MKKRKRVAGYFRVSTGPQEDGLSLSIQEEACAGFAIQKDGEMPEELRYREVWSGADHHRAQLDKLMADAAAGLFDIVIFYSPTRMGREPLHNSMTYAALRALGVEVHFVHGDMEDTPEGRLVLYVQGYAGQQERAQFAQRSMSTKLAIAKSGRLPVGTGAGLFGYDYDRQNKKRSINEEEAVAVRMGFQWRLDRVNDYQIAVRLNLKGFRTKRGCAWQHRTVSRMLANESYAGVDYYGRYRWRRVEGKRGGGDSSAGGRGGTDRGVYPADNQSVRV